MALLFIKNASPFADSTPGVPRRPWMREVCPSRTRFGFGPIPAKGLLWMAEAKAVPYAAPRRLTSSLRALATGAALRACTPSRPGHCRAALFGPVPQRLPRWQVHRLLPTDAKKALPSPDSGITDCTAEISPEKSGSPPGSGGIFGCQAANWNRAGLPTENIPYFRILSRVLGEFPGKSKKIPVFFGFPPVSSGFLRPVAAEEGAPRVGHRLFTKYLESRLPPPRFGKQRAAQAAARSLPASCILRQ